MNGREMGMRRIATLALAAALAAACARGDAPPADDSAPAAAAQADASVPARPDCAREADDDARASCLAVDTARQLHPESGARAMELLHRGDTICVLAVPTQLATDGETRVSVLAGRVVKVEESDSIGCQ
jgi:hypothetical protein